MKKILLKITLVTVFIMSTMCICPFAGTDDYSGSCGDNAYYSFNPETGALEISGSGKITKMNSAALYPWGGYRDEIKTLTVGEEITSIGSSAFDNLTYLEKLCWNSKNMSDSYGTIYSMGTNTEGGTTVIFGDRVKHIPNSLLSYNPSSYSPKLASVTLSDSIRSVGKSAFYGCKEVPIMGKLPNAEVIGGGAFYYCTGMGEIDLSKVKYVEKNAFQLSSISGVVDLSSIIALGERAFSSCGNITELTIGERLKTYGDYCLSGIDVDVLYWNVRTIKDFHINSGIGVSADKLVFGDTVEYIPARMFGPMGDLDDVGEVVFSDSILEVGNEAFCNNTYMTGNVNLPNVRKIGYSAFRNAYSLTGDVYMPCVEIIGSDAFYGCTGINGGITIPQATHIGDSAFEGCRNASGRLVTADAQVVGCRAFYNCVNLTGDIYLLNAVTIGESAFYQCNLITGAPLFPCARTIDDCAFYGCAGLTGEPSLGNLVNLGDDAFRGCTGITGTVSLPNVVGEVTAFDRCEGIENVVLNNNVYKIGFLGCTSLKSVTGIENVRSVQDFSYCTSLPSISLPKCEYLGSFKGCTSLKSIEVSRSLKSADTYVFQDCTSLESFIHPSDCYIYNKYMPSGCQRSQYSGDAPTGITLSGKTYALLGDSFALNKEVLPADANNHITSWSSSNIYVATVTSEGIIKCIAPGTVTITAETLNGHTGTHTITITDPVTFITEQTEYTIYTEDTQDITVYMTSPYYDGYDAKWTLNSGSTSFKGEASVDYVDGKYALTAKYYGGMGSCKLVLRVGLCTLEITVHITDEKPSRENIFTKDYISTALSNGTLMVAGFDSSGKLLRLEIIDGYESSLAGFDDCAYMRAYQWQDLEGMNQLGKYTEITLD